MDEAALTKLADLAGKVGSEHDALLEATREETAAEVRLLSSVVAAVKPALAALASRFKVYERTWWPDNVSTDTETRTHEVPGLRVDGDGPDKDHPRATRGSYEGSALYLLRDGSFLVVKYGGSWSQWQGDGSAMEAEVVPLAVEELPENGWDVEAIVKTIAKRLESHVGQREGATKKAQERARKLAALAELV